MRSKPGISTTPRTFPPPRRASDKRQRSASKPRQRSKARLRSGASLRVSDADIGRSWVSLTCLIGDDFTMYLWDPTNHGTKPVSRLLGHQNKVNHVQFSPDGTTIASAGWD